MTAEPRPARRAAKAAKPTRTLEQTLWDAADKMRGNLEAAEYKHVALGLVFLKYVSDAFEQRRLWLEAATADKTNAESRGAELELRGSSRAPALPVRGSDRVAWNT
jgi:type I restriction-modification system DNA methylase subunit